MCRHPARAWKLDGLRSGESNGRKGLDIRPIRAKELECPMTNHSEGAWVTSALLIVSTCGTDRWVISQRGPLSSTILFKSSASVWGVQGARDSTYQNAGARVSDDQSERRSTDRWVISQRWRYKRSAPSFLVISFKDAVPTARRFVREIGKHVRHVWSHGHESHFPKLRSGDIRRWRHLSPCQSTNRSRPPCLQRTMV